MSLRGGDEADDDLRPFAFVSFRCDVEVKAYVKEQSLLTDRSETKVWLDAVGLERELERVLAEVRPDLKAYASSVNLSLKTELGRVLGPLVKLGLEQWKASQTKGKK